jgi:hypothetical protein
MCWPCACRAECSREPASSTTRRGQGRTTTLSVYEDEQQRAKAFNRSARAPEVLRKRSAIERLISHFVRLGMRHARFLGLLATQFQAFMTATAHNLQRHVTLTVARRRAASTA